MMSMTNQYSQKVEMIILAMIAKHCPNLQLGDRLPNYKALVSNGRLSTESVDDHPVQVVEVVSKVFNLPLDEKDFEGIEIPGRFIHPFDCKLSVSAITFAEKALIRYAVSN